MARFFVSAWSDPTSKERLELVFADRNKNYGAYEIRQLYERTTARALLISVLFFSSLVSIPMLLKLFRGEVEVIRQASDFEYVFQDLPPLEKDLTPPPALPVPPAPTSTVETVRFTTPVVVDNNPAIDQPPVQAVPITIHVGPITLPGDIGIDVLPTQPLAGNTDPDKTYTWVNEMPGFPGGDAAMYDYLRNTMHYPPGALEKNISGRVYINFVVDQNGEIKDVKVLQGIGYGCDEEAVRVIKAMPAWKPGKHNGRTVSVSYNMPINFTMK